MAENRRIVVTGATGMIGGALGARLRERGYDLVVFSRDPEAARRMAPGAAEYVQWQPAETGAWEAAVDGAHAVVGLAGASILGSRWSAGYKRLILESRVVGTRGLVRAMERAGVRPRVFVSGSAVGYYGLGEADDPPADEGAPPGDDFLARTCVAWEQEAARAERLGVRVARVRTAVVLGREGGPLPRLLPLFRLGLGGPILPGSQWMPWIQIADEIGLLLFALEDERVEGPLNAVAPEPATQRAFAATLGRVVGRPSWLPVPGFMLRVALGQVATTLTRGRHVVPKKALALGYRFQYPTLEHAVRGLGVGG